MSGRLYLVAVVFSLSGAASLMDQVVWLRYLSLVFGNTTYAAATLLAVFMAGLGAGAWGVGRLADRWRRPLRCLALVELSVGLFAVASPHFFALMDGAYVALYRNLGNHPAAFALARALLAAVFLLPPTFLMGATFPVVLRGVSDWQPGGVGRPAALLYAANTLGAVAGTALAGFWSVRVVGLTATLWLAASCNLVAASGFALLSGPARAPAQAGASAALARARPAGWMLGLVAAMGATSLAYEVLWTRILLHYLGSSVYAYSMMLVIFLFGIGAGSLLATPWIERTRDALGGLARIQLGIGFSCLLQTLTFPLLNPIRVSLARTLAAEDFAGVCLAELVALLPILGPPTCLMGMSFPLAIRLVSADPRHRGRDTGAVYGANTVGSVLGSLAAGFALIPWLGTQNSLVGVAVLNLAIGAGLLQRSPGEVPLRRAAWALTAVALLSSLWLPANSVIFAARALIGDAGESVAYFEESANASVTVRRVPSEEGFYHSLEVNGVNVAGTHPSLYAVQKMQGHLPLLLTPGAQSVLHIGFGSGGTAYAVSRHRVREIVIAELTPEVLTASDHFFAHINHGVLADKRIQVELNDGRNFLMATPRHFDVILSDSVHPHYAGNGSLYSREYFALARDHLATGGTVSMWLPMYSLTTENYAMIVRAFQDVFPYTAIWYEPSVLNSFTIVTGRLAPPGPWPTRQPLGPPRARAELVDLGITGPAELIACYLAGDAALADWLSAYAPHVDDVPAVEYESGLLLDRDTPWLSTFEALLALRPDEPPAELLAGLTQTERLRAERVWRERKDRLETHRAALRARLSREQGGRAGR